MTPDLDDRIRTALRARAAEVIPRQTVRRPDDARPSHRWVPPLLAAAAVIVLAAAIAVAVTVRHGSGSGTGRPAAGGVAYAGYQWRVTSLQDRHGLLEVPPDIDATVAFTSSAVYGDDTVNGLSARYIAGASTYTVTNAGTTLVGYAGGDDSRARVIAAVDALFFTVSSAVPDGSAPEVTIRATVQGDSLTLQTVGTEIITVTLERQGPVAPELTAAPSTTPEAPSGASSGFPGSATATDLPYSGPASP